MPCKVKDADGTLRTITSCKAKDGGSTRTIIRMKVMDSDNVTLRTVATFATTLSVTAPDVADSGYDSNVRSGSSTATPSGGLGPYSYSWAHVSGTAMTVSGSTTATATFTSPELAPDQLVGAVYRVTCTDSSGQTATADIDISFQFFSPF